MDTPYNRRVPLPPRYQRPRNNGSRFGRPELTYHSAGWLSYLALAILISFAAFWYKTHAREDLARTGHLSNYSIAGDVAEARTIMHRLRDELLQKDVHSNIPSLTTTINQSADALSAATSFVLCHGTLTLDFVRGEVPDVGCDVLFERVLDCQYQFIRFHEHHKRVVTGCEFDVVRELEGEIGRTAEWEHRHAMEIVNGWSLPYVLWKSLKDTITLRRVDVNVQDGDSRLRNWRAIDLEAVLGVFST